ncbi:MAG TPA: DUF507 family protein, partial [Aquificae bacterium]|nr:DUF507 family protein [Aquificota bacterium]
MLPKKLLKIAADKIFKELTEKNYLILDNPEKFKENLRKLLLEEYKKERELEKKVDEIIEQNLSEIDFVGISVREARRKILDELSKKEGIVIEKPFGRTKANYLANKIMKMIEADEDVDYTIDRTQLRLKIFNILMWVANENRKIIETVKRRITSHSRPIYEGFSKFSEVHSSFNNLEKSDCALVIAPEK